MSALRRVAIVTGAAQGIGRGIALRLAKDGLKVVVNDVPSKKAILEKVVGEMGDNNGLVVPGDAADEGQVRELVKTAVSKFGSLDVVTSIEDLDRVMKINTRSAFIGYKTAAKQMIQQGRGGRIIGASSVAGKKGFAGNAAYGGSKWFIRGLTQTAAQEWGKYGITVNAYAPGVVDTPMIRDAVRHYPGSGEAWLASAREVTAMGTTGQPEDIAALVSYLASEEAKFMTGQTLNINGGYVAFD